MLRERTRYNVFPNKRFFSKKGTYILVQVYFFSLQHLPRNTNILKILIVWSRVKAHSRVA